PPAVIVIFTIKMMLFKKQLTKCRINDIFNQNHVGGITMQYYVNAFKNYVNFQGRARRKEYWMFALFSFIVSTVIAIVAMLIRFPLLSDIYALAVLCPTIALIVRRLHDIGKGWIWILIGLIPIIGQIWLIVLMCMDSQPGSNEFGPNPKGL
ncbi:MAG: DUF805 domain-containing protein, partial [Eisenbergiella sp.]